VIVSLKEIRNYIINVVVPLVVGAAGVLGVRMCSGMNMANVYEGLTKPSFAPPVSVYPFVWVVIYILIGTSSYMIRRNDNRSNKVKDAMFYYSVQLGLNFLWIVLFLGFGLRFTALVCLCIMIAVVVFMIMSFSNVDRKAGYINLIYLVWLVYLGFMNYFLWLVNC
jgi:tryptophan-rich sensory protein